MSAWQPTPVFLPRKSPCTKEPGGLQSIGSQRVTYDWSNLACTCRYILSFHPNIMTASPLPFQFGYLLFLSLFWLLWLTFPILGWIEVVRVGILVLFQSSMGRLSAFQCWILCWLCIFHSFYYVYICFLCTHFVKSF